MAIILAVFVAVQLAMPLLVRAHLAPPTRSTIQITTENVEDFRLGTPTSGGGDSALRLAVKAPDTGAWVLSNQTVNASGHTVEAIPVSANSGPCAPSPGAPERGSRRASRR
jgi:hypothetical protein